jgi:hypothetical protein
MVLCVLQPAHFTSRNRKPAFRASPIGGEGWGAAVAFHPIIPGIAGRNIRREPRLPSALFRMPDRLAPLALFGWSAHGVKDARVRAASATSHRLRVPATIAPNDKAGVAATQVLHPPAQ